MNALPWTSSFIDQGRFHSVSTRWEESKVKFRIVVIILYLIYFGTQAYTRRHLEPDGDAQIIYRMEE